MLVGYINDSVVWRLQTAIMIWMKCHLNGLCPCFSVIKLTYLGLQLNLFKSSSTLVYQPLETRKSFTVFYITKVQLQSALESFLEETSGSLAGHVLDILRVELHCYHPSSQSPVLPGCPQQQRRGDNHCEEAPHKCIEWHLQWIPEQHHHGLQPPAPWDHEVIPSFLPMPGSTLENLTRMTQTSGMIISTWPSLLFLVLIDSRGRMFKSFSCLLNQCPILQGPFFLNSPLRQFFAIPSSIQI